MVLEVWEELHTARAEPTVRIVQWSCQWNANGPVETSGVARSSVGALRAELRDPFSHDLFVGSQCMESEQFAAYRQHLDPLGLDACPDRLVSVGFHCHGGV